MTYPRFFQLFAAAALIAAGGALTCHALLPLDYAVPLTVGIFILLSLLSLGIFWVGKRTAAAKNKFLFGNAFLGITMVKLFLCGGVAAAYILLGAPENKLFIIPFFLIYLTFTLLEVVALVKIAAETPPPSTATGEE
ncbi:hypothetical protein [Lewinella sp. W8]|uniref:hypothetical protein n=1 Tax=Lewinella sp. W8 TaxID=2528208 RepID=UPI001068CDFC|nr:hypothetical protein [Lewinella sp. W8]MTB50185.1 hypothetical protein [Lewinella sp. W8]